MDHSKVEAFVIGISGAFIGTYLALVSLYFVSEAWEKRKADRKRGL